MTHKTRTILLNLAFPVLAVAVLVAVWAIAAAVLGKPLLLPDPLETLRAFFGLLGTGAFWAAFGMTVLRAALAYLIAGIVAFVLAFFSRNGYVRRALYPLMSFVRAVPTMVVIFLFLLWVKARWSPVWVSVTVLLPTMYAAFTDAFDAIDKGLFEMSNVYRVPFARQVKQMYIPLLVPSLLSSLGFLSLAVKLVVAAEALAMTATGLGSMLYQARLTFETAQLLAVGLAAVLAGFVIDGCTFLLRRAVPWT